MGKLVDELKSFLDTEEGKEWARKWGEKKKRDQEIREKQIERFHNLPKPVQHNFIEKCIEKYYSDKYVDKEMFKCGCEPREELFYLILDYSRKYGIKADISKLNEDFLAERYLLDSKYEISLYVGQGSFVRINII